MIYISFSEFSKTYYNPSISEIYYLDNKYLNLSGRALNPKHYSVVYKKKRKRKLYYTIPSTTKKRNLKWSVKVPAGIFKTYYSEENDTSYFIIPIISKPLNSDILNKDQYCDDLPQQYTERIIEKRKSYENR